MKYKMIAIFVIALLLVFLSGFFFMERETPILLDNNQKVVEKNKTTVTAMKIESQSFENNGMIPVKYTCDGQKVHPPLSISGVPKDAKSLVLIMEDTDVPRVYQADGIYDHWVVFNMPTSTQFIKEGELAPGIYGASTSGLAKYVAPCPPDKEHRYIFSLYALDIGLDLGPGVIKEKVLEAMEGHILEKVDLVGRYDRTK